MYRLSNTENLSFLVNAEVMQVCIGANEAILNFDNDVRITILADFSVAAADGVAVRYDDPRKGAAALAGLLGDSIAEATATPGGDLRVVFTSGVEVIAFDSNVQYESFWIKGPSGEIIV